VCVCLLESAGECWRVLEKENAIRGRSEMLEIDPLSQKLVILIKRGQSREVAPVWTKCWKSVVTLRLCV